MFNTGIMSWLRSMADQIRYHEINYVPTKLVMPSRLIDSSSKAWVGLEQVLADIISFSGIKTNTALEFGVEFGYSAAALANYFTHVTGVDIFTGDHHAGYHGDIYEETRTRLSQFTNIDLIKMDYRDFILKEERRYDLIHVDIIHTFEDTYHCGLWSAEHSGCTIFHDTESFPDVKAAVAAVARRTGKKFYNYKKCNGLGIVL